jgi:hypothetical protein
MLNVQNKVSHWGVAYVGPVSRNSRFATQWRRQYARFDLLPTKTKEAVAVLSMGKDSERIPGVGTKVTEKAYWLLDNESLLEEYKDGNDV